MEVMTTSPVTPAHGEYTDNGRPKGFSSLTPFVALEDPKAALEFYAEVFGARVVNSTEMEGVIIHAELDFGCGRLQLGPTMRDYHLLALNPEAEDAQFSLGIYVADVDRVVEDRSRSRRCTARGCDGFRPWRPIREHPRSVRDPVVGDDAGRGPQR